MFARHYKTVGRCQVAYLDEGRGPPLLFIHGIPTSSYLWREVIGELHRDYRCVAPDLLGLGHTVGPPDDDYSMPAQARRCLGLLDALELERVTVVAHDQGGAAGQYLAVRHPDRVRRLVLTNCVCYDNWPVPIIRLLMLLARFEALSRLLGRTPLFRYWAHTRFGLRLGVHRPASFTADTIGELIEPLMANQAARERFRQFVLAGSPRHTMELVAGLRAYHRPALVVWGEQDRLLPMKWAHRLATDLPQARLVTIADAGHFLQEDRPRELAQAIGAFLGETAF